MTGKTRKQHTSNKWTQYQRNEDDDLPKKTKHDGAVVTSNIHSKINRHTSPIIENLRPKANWHIDRETHIASLPNFVEPLGFMIRVHSVTRKENYKVTRLGISFQTTTQLFLITTSLSPPHQPLYKSSQTRQNVNKKSKFRVSGMVILYTIHACKCVNQRMDRELVRNREKRLLA